MEYKFGEMSSCKEINTKARELLETGNTEDVRLLAEENGLADYVEYFISGDILDLCDPVAAAVGKLDVEATELKVQGLLTDWVNYIKVKAEEDEKIALSVRKKSKSLAGCIAELMKWGFDHAIDVPKEIVEKAGIKAPRVTFGVPGMAEGYIIIEKYYLS